MTLIGIPLAWNYAVDDSEKNSPTRSHVRSTYWSFVYIPVRPESGWPKAIKIEPVQ